MSTRTIYLHKLVYYEVFDGIEAAIVREKQIKERFNPTFEDLYGRILDKRILEPPRMTDTLG